MIEEWEGSTHTNTKGYDYSKKKFFILTKFGISF